MHHWHSYGMYIFYVILNLNIEIVRRQTTRNPMEANLPNIEKLTMSQRAMVQMIERGLLPKLKS